MKNIFSSAGDIYFCAKVNNNTTQAGFSDIKIE